jgi:hypothetical protein
VGQQASCSCDSVPRQLGTEAASRKFRVLNGRPPAEGIYRLDFYPFLAFVKESTYELFRDTFDN